MMEVKDFIQTRASTVTARLKELLHTKEPFAKDLFEGGAYSTLGPGKRLRPCLLLSILNTLGIPEGKGLDVACALELIHTYSMIHDDLPCMDDDDYRRGRPTLHKTIGEGQAVLVGDFLLTYAFEVLTNAPNLSAEQKVALIQVLSARSGALGMIGGQGLDLKAEDAPVDLKELQQIHLLKTGALMVAAVEMGCIVANACPKTTSSLVTFAREIGLAYQVMDDVLDVTAGLEKHGRLEGSDKINGKTTYVSLLGLEEAKRQVQLHFEMAKGALESLRQETTLLLHLARAMTHRSL